MTPDEEKLAHIANLVKDWNPYTPRVKTRAIMEELVALFYD
jgi:hypothetical protein